VGELPVYRAFLHISQIPRKNSPYIKNFSFLLKTLGKERPSIFLKAEPLWKQTPISGALLGTSFGVPNKGALPLGSPYRAPSERDVPLLELSFIHLPKSPVYDPFQVPQTSRDIR
jgi:hypothetical protein